MSDTLPTTEKPAVTAPPATGPVSAKDRIITHMNKDHELSLRDYLTFYKGIVPSRNVQLKDITLDKLTISYELIHNRGIDELEAVIDLTPPMKSMAEARDVLVGMALQASEGLGYATVTPVDAFLPPTARSVPIILSILAGIYYVFVNSAALDNPNSVLRQYKLYDYEFVPTLIKAGVYLALIYHVGEALVLFIWTGAYRVPSLKRMAWVVSGFFEGWPALARFRSLMEEKDKASAKTKENEHKAE
ncbi:hypothetical protein BZA70DRAFT_294062 [Myxozyma melibiosi]|uniref:DUF2470 domain-containing protein n=1 Tax=Myxozyma melibiosi TaxID=54550 RepID=A0ABR1F9Y9_9ASCO